jgi:hypothetical protein
MVGDPSDSPDIPEETLACNICGQKFDTVESLKEHKSAEMREAALNHKGVD